MLEPPNSVVASSFLMIDFRNMKSFTCAALSEHTADQKKYNGGTPRRLACRGMTGFLSPSK